MSLQAQMLSNQGSANALSYAQAVDDNVHEALHLGLVLVLLGLCVRSGGHSCRRRSDDSGSVIARPAQKHCTQRAEEAAIL